MKRIFQEKAEACDDVDINIGQSNDIDGDAPNWDIMTHDTDIDSSVPGSHDDTSEGSSAPRSTTTLMYLQRFFAQILGLTI